MTIVKRENDQFQTHRAFVFLHKSKWPIKVKVKKNQVKSSWWLLNSYNQDFSPSFFNADRYIKVNFLCGLITNFFKNSFSSRYIISIPIVNIQ